MNYKYLKIFSNKGGNDSKECVVILCKIYKNFFKKFNVKYEEIKNFKYIVLLKFLSSKKINFLKKEKGIHKIIRYSPYKKNSVQTSYCSINIFNTKEFNESEISFKRKDLKIDTFKSSGAGGQSVNKTNSAVRIKHIPTNISVECQKERSQHINKKIALELLKIKVINIKSSYKKIYLENKIKRIYFFNKSIVLDKINNKKININKILKGSIDKFYNN
ncbi:peptide chain release factor-like protein [Candidatus Vidania fulgoroideorum]